MGSLELRIATLRDGTYFPEWGLERQQPAEQALYSTVMGAYVNGVSTRKGTKFVEKMGLEGMDKSEVSRINQQLDTRMKDVQSRRFTRRDPYEFLDATETKLRENRRVVNASLVLAVRGE